MPVRRRRKEAHQHGEDNSLREAGCTARVGQCHGRIHVHNLAQLICRSHELHSQYLLPYITKAEDLIPTLLEIGPHALQTVQHVSISISEDQLRPCDLDTVDQGLGREVGVDQCRGGADGYEPHPSAEHVRGVEHEDGDEVTGLDTLRQEPLGVLVDAVVGLVVGEAFGA